MAHAAMVLWSSFELLLLRLHQTEQAEVEPRAKLRAEGYLPEWTLRRTLCEAFASLL
jgi:hypothetical protein